MTPGRAIYEYRRPGDPAPSIPWEELDQGARDFYEEMFRAGAAAEAGRMLTSYQVAEMAGVSDRTVIRWEDQGLLTAKRTAGGHRRFLAGDVREFLAARAEGAGGG